MRRFRALFILGIRSAAILSGFVIASLLVGQSALGVYADFEQVLRYAGFVTTLLGFGFVAEITKSGRDLKARKVDEIRWLIVMSLIPAVASTVIALVLWIRGDGPGVWILVLPVALYQLYSLMVSGLMANERRPIESNLWTFGTGSIVLLLLLLFLNWTNFDLTFGDVAVGLLLVRLAYVLIPALRIGLRWDAIFPERQLSAVLRDFRVSDFYFVSLINSFQLAFEVFLISIFFNDTTFALFAIILRIGQGLGLLLTVPNSILPGIVGEQGVENQLSNVMKLPRVVAIACFLGVCVACKPLLGIWFDVVDWEFCVGLVFYVFAWTFNVISGSNGMILLLKGEERAHLTIQLTCLAFFMPLLCVGGWLHLPLLVFLALGGRILVENVWKTVRVFNTFGINTLKP